MLLLWFFVTRGIDTAVPFKDLGTVRRYARMEANVHGRRLSRINCLGRYSGIGLLAGLNGLVGFIEAALNSVEVTH